MNANELVIQLHDLAEVAKDHSDKGYELSTHEKQQEFARKRNYHYSNTDNPIDFPKEDE